MEGESQWERVLVAKYDNGVVSNSVISTTIRDNMTNFVWWRDVCGLGGVPR